jgi:alkylation response protein AidB-like acyl-CoA dehydrogenase
MHRIRANTPPCAIAGDYLQRARDFAPLLAAAAGEIDRRRELPPAIRQDLIARGFFRLLLPGSLGGAELLPADYVPIIEEIAKTDASTAWSLNQTAGCSMTRGLSRAGRGAGDLRPARRHPRLGSGPR